MSDQIPPSEEPSAGTSVVEAPTNPQVTLSDAPPAPDHAVAVSAPEELVVAHPPPDPDYPRYRVEPGTRFRLREADPDETEHYERKKDVAKALEKQRDRIRELQAGSTPSARRRC